MWVIERNYLFNCPRSGIASVDVAIPQYLVSKAENGGQFRNALVKAIGEKGMSANTAQTASIGR
jgi:hypothetical protein